MKKINIYEILENYDAILFDAFGVLIDLKSSLVGAQELINHLNSMQKPYYILTNDASKLPETLSKKFYNFGLSIKTKNIITSGCLLKNYFITNNLQNKNCAVLGPADSLQYVELAGGKIVSVKDSFEVLVICDETGFDFVETLDHAISQLFIQIDSGKTPHIVIPNPDLIYPKDKKLFGITAGSIAHIIESILKLRYPNHNNLKFSYLGKPYKTIFEEAINLTKTTNMLMIGDQLQTDIKGANSCELDSALVTGGVSSIKDSVISKELRPAYLLDSLKGF